jgi:hypothetical protein
LENSGDLFITTNRNPLTAKNTKSSQRSQSNHS